MATILLLEKDYKGNERTLLEETTDDYVRVAQLRELARLIAEGAGSDYTPRAVILYVNGKPHRISTDHVRRSDLPYHRSKLRFHSLSSPGVAKRVLKRTTTKDMRRAERRMDGVVLPLRPEHAVYEHHAATPCPAEPSPVFGPSAPLTGFGYKPAFCWADFVAWEDVAEQRDVVNNGHGSHSVDFADGTVCWAKNRK